MKELAGRGTTSRDDKRRLMRAGETGAWLTVMPSQRYNSLLSKEEFQDNVRLRYGLRPLDLSDHCDGCGARFSAEHRLSCKKGSLVHVCHNDAHDQAAALAPHALSPSCVKCKPNFFYGTGMRAGQQVGQERNADAAGD